MKSNLKSNKTSKFISALAAAAISALAIHSGEINAAAEYKIVTASDKGTYFAIGKDLAKFVAPDADIQLEVLPTSGSARSTIRGPPRAT